MLIFTNCYTILLEKWQTFMFRHFEISVAKRKLKSRKKEQQYVFSCLNTTEKYTKTMQKKLFKIEQNTHNSTSGSQWDS